MRLYGGRTLRNSFNKALNTKTETRDGRVWEVLPNEKRVRVLIQGTSQLVVAYYPENWNTIPSWLKVGNSVTIRHTGGVKGRIEVVGNGMMIPSTVDGGTAFPDTVQPDGIVNGLKLTAPVGSYMSVLITKGAIRVDDTLYSDFVSDVSAYVAGMGYSVDDLCAVRTLAAAPPSGQARYDRIVVGPDMAVDVIQGTASSSPVLPSIDGSHFSLGWVLVKQGDVQITASAFNATYEPPHLASLTISPSADHLHWGETVVNVTLTATDQYGNYINGPWEFNLSIQHGGGSLDAASKTGNSSATFVYTRGLTDSSPNLVGSITGKSFATNATFITLYNIDGLPM